MAEDNPADAFFFQEALEASRIKATIRVVGDGTQALKFLLRQPPHSDAPRPDVLVLDLNLPFVKGHEVIQEMATEPSLRSIPVAILTTSTSERYVCDAYPGPCLYFTKTDDFQRLQEIIRQIAQHAGVPLT